MRLTVGPLPPAVYWRRRAVVLGGLVLAIAVYLYSCGGTRSAGSGDTATGGTRSPDPTSTLLTPVVDWPPASRGSSTAPSGPPASGTPGGECTDTELAVTVSTDGNRTEFAAGSYVRFYLKIKNVSTRSCSRDIGPTYQELRLVQGTAKVWSSDDCGGPTGSFLRTLAPGEELDDFNVTWNGRASTNCQTKPVPAAGGYQLTGRVGTKWSVPVALTLTAAK